MNNVNTAVLDALDAKIITGKDGRLSYMVNKKFCSKAAYEAATASVVEDVPVIGNTPSAVNTPSNFKSVGGMSVGNRLGHRNEDGSFTTALGHQATPGHRHVSNVWGSKQPALVDYIQTIKEDGINKQDILVPIKNLTVTPDLRIVGTGSYLGLESDNAPVDAQVLNPALKNLVMRMYATDAKSEANDSNSFGVPSCYNMNTARWMIEHGHSDQLAGHINEGLQESLANLKRETSQDKGLLLRCRRNGDGDYFAEGVLSELYGIIDNDDVLSMIADNFPDQHKKGLLASHASYNGRDMNLNILVPDLCKERPDSEYGVGIAVRNSETGRYTLKLSAFLFRAICLNGCIWDRKESEIKVNKKHLGRIDWEALKSDIQQVIQFGLSEGELLLGQFDLAQQIAVENPMKTIACLGKTNKLSVGETKAWYSNFLKGEYENNAFGVINGLTQAAQEFEGNARVELESKASHILTPSLEADINAIGKQWKEYEILTARAWKTEEKSMKQYLGVAV